MKKIIVLMPFIASMFLVGCNNGNNPSPDPVVDYNSEYKTETYYNGYFLQSTGSITWKDHHIVNDEGTRYIKQESKWVEKPYKITHEYAGNDLLKKEYYLDGKIETREINKYNEHHDKIKNEKYNYTREDNPDPAYITYEYTYDNNGNILTMKESRCDIPSKKRINFIGITTNIYDSKQRLTNIKLENHQSEEGPLELITTKTTSYTYKGDFKNYTTMHEEIKSHDGTLMEKTDIICELDQDGNQIDINKEYYDYDRDIHTHTKTLASYDENNYKISHRVYDLLAVTYDYPIIESYSISYHNHNYAQVDLEITTTYELDKQSTKFKKYTYDKKNRLISLDDCATVMGEKHQHYVYGYND